MASRSEENLYCPVCHGIFQDPVLLSCCHSFCKVCVQTWWAQTAAPKCPLCKSRSLQRDPPLNLALKNLCEAFLQERAQRRVSAGSADLCSLHSETLRLFCLDHQQPVCVICLHSNSHTSHSIRPVDEAALDFKEGLRELLKPLQERLEVLNDVKGNFDQTARNIEVQAQYTEKQIQDVFSMLQKLLQEEEQARLAAVREEKRQKSRKMKRKSEALSREIAALSDTVRATDEQLRAEDLSFLQNYRTAAQRVQRSLPDVPEPTAGALIETTKHLNNLHVNILDSVKKKVSSTLNPQTADPEPAAGVSLEDNLSRLRVGERRPRYGPNWRRPAQSGAASLKDCRT
ncbi:E3 ubiquitin-protein ligase TRIM35-like [Pempheris klunzingeri]|uniref:E3 ubiquitin-protein ligase TRIM35-like n=1 Tax=Pempheris klunzingeri TaxID=3127111 RepID=UPI0039816EFE